MLWFLIGFTTCVSTFESQLPRLYRSNLRFSRDPGGGPTGGTATGQRQQEAGDVSLG